MVKKKKAKRGHKLLKRRKKPTKRKPKSTKKKARIHGGVLKHKNKKIVVHATSESEDSTNTVSSYPIQGGNAMVDHTQRDKRTWEISGKLIATATKAKYKKVGKHKKLVRKGKSAQAKLRKTYAQLVTWQTHGYLLRYDGAIHESNVIITELTKTFDEGGMKNAVKFSMTLQKVYVPGKKGSKKHHKRKHKGVKKAHRKKSKSSSKRYVTVKPGNTYSYFSLKYGSSISQLRKWNKWPDRRIPIGKRCRVK